MISSERSDLQALLVVMGRTSPAPEHSLTIGEVMPLFRSAQLAASRLAVLPSESNESRAACLRVLATLAALVGTTSEAKVRHLIVDLVNDLGAIVG